MTKTQDEIQRLIDENKPLMECCSKVAHDLFVAEQSKAVWIWIGEHANEINQASFGKAFGMWQEMTLTQMFVAVGRAFDEQRHSTTYSIRRILTMMREAHLINRDRFISYLRSFEGEEAQFEECEDRALVARGTEMIAVRRPTPKNSVELERIIRIRHTEVAHNSDAHSEDASERATFEDVEHALMWAKKFIAMVGQAFGSHVFQYDDGTYWSEYGIKSSLVSVRRLAHRAQIVKDAHFAERERLMAESSKT